jgi:Pvc16 N-terminal domain
VSTALAPAAALNVIAKLIDRNVSNANLSTLFGGPALTLCQSPDQVPIDAEEADHINLFLYSVAMNAGWRNVELPMRDAAGNRTGRPPLAIDLHFMMSAYGQDDYHPEMLLGIGMQALHETPFLDRGFISSIFAGASSNVEVALATSLLDQQIEQIKIAPHDLSADDLYKLWSAFGSKCRPSAAYIATVVLIQSSAPLASALPVLSYNIDVIPYIRPQITSIVPAIFTLPALPATQQLTLTGTGLTGPGTSALFNAAISAPLVTAPAPNTATVSVPATVQPGVNMIAIVRDVTIGPPPDKLVGSSAPASFVVQPTVGAIATSALGGGALSFSVGVWPACGAQQSASLLLDQIDVPVGATPLHFRLDALPEDISGTTIVFQSDTTASMNGIATGTYLLRLSIDGVQSVPGFDPVLGFNSPTVNV